MPDGRGIFLSGKGNRRSPGGKGPAQTVFGGCRIQVLNQEHCDLTRFLLFFGCNHDTLFPYNERKVMIMTEPRLKRIRRSPQERVAELDALMEKQTQLIADLEERKRGAIASFDEKIAGARARIKELEAKKTNILSPKPARKPRKTKKQKMQDILKEAQKHGMKPEEIAERLGITLEETK